MTNLQNYVEISIAENLLSLIDGAIKDKDIVQLWNIYGIVNDFIGKPIYDKRADFVIINDYLGDILKELESGKEPTVNSRLREMINNDLRLNP